MTVRTNFSLLALVLVVAESLALSNKAASRRQALGWITTATAGAIVTPRPVLADELPERFSVDDFLRTGMVSQPMGVSGQAGKSRPETGVILRDGVDVSRNPRTGDVAAEILVKVSGSEEKLPVLISYASPWPLATGTVFDVECRDPSTGDDVFLAVSKSTGGKLSIADVNDSFLVDNIFASTGRFSAYGEPTDVKVKNSRLNANYKILDVSFSTLSQSTQTEIPRRARLVATIPAGTEQAVILVASASALRWKKGAEQQIADVVNTFRAVPAPKTSLKVRPKDRNNASQDLSMS